MYECRRHEDFHENSFGYRVVTIKWENIFFDKSDNNYEYSTWSFFNILCIPKRKCIFTSRIFSNYCLHSASPKDLLSISLRLTQRDYDIIKMKVFERKSCV